MSGFETASNFFHACESVKGWGECSQYVEPGAPFSAQCEPLIDIHTVEDYVNWMTGVCETACPENSYVLHASAYDETTNTAMFFGTYTLRHTGDGGPVPPTNKQTSSQYVYIIETSDSGKVKSMQKVWNAPWALRELGWA